MTIVITEYTPLFYQWRIIYKRKIKSAFEFEVRTKKLVPIGLITGPSNSDNMVYCLKDLEYSNILVYHIGYFRYRKATQREEFLYHILGPHVLEKE